MGTDNLFWKRKNRSQKRKSQNRGKPPPSFLIVCEGEKTEPNYFKSFKLSSVSVKVVGYGYNTLSLVKKTLETIEKAKEDDELFDQAWCVFDKDSFPLNDFNEAISLAKRKNIEVAYSNEAFELWYLLHFNYYDSGFSRNDYEKMLSHTLGHKYQKNSPLMYKELLNKQETALRNAERLLKSYTQSDPGKDNPSTTVHRLVVALNRFIHHSPIPG